MGPSKFSFQGTFTKSDGTLFSPSDNVVITPSQTLLMVLKLKMCLLLSILLQDSTQHNIEQLHQEIMKQ